MTENKTILVTWDEVHPGLVIREAKKDGEIEPALQLGEQPETNELVYPQSREFENGAASAFFFLILSSILAGDYNQNIEITLGDDEPIGVDGMSIVEVSTMLTVAEDSDF